MDRIEKIVREVRKNGDSALLKYTRKFDGVELKPDRIEVSSIERKELAAGCPAEMTVILEEAASNIENYARKQRSLYKEQLFENGRVTVRDRFIPVESAGIYVPGGGYPYPSTVLMCAVPARAAGVRMIYMVTPPTNLTPEVAAAADIAGVDRIFRIGGPHAVAALAFGTQTVPVSDIIVGPGNSYVQAAKKMVSDTVGIDMIAGPSEVVIVADGSQDPATVALDLSAQAEHAGDAGAVLITDSGDFAGRVRDKMEKEYLDRTEFRITETLEEAVAEVNDIAPEHLQLMVRDDELEHLAADIKNAGAVFLGSSTPVALGDYWAGPSHTLPTGGTARFREGLNVRTFLKNVSFISWSGKGIEQDARKVEKFARSEGMEKHAASVKIRRDK